MLVIPYDGNKDKDTLAVWVVAAQVYFRALSVGQIKSLGGGAGTDRKM